jgi:hypothetical protein
VTTASDESKSAPERLEAFRQLRLRFPHAASEPAIKLLKDKDVNIAAAAARYLAAQVTMMNHATAPLPVPSGHVHGSDVSDPVARALDALRGALTDPREDVRALASTTLASLGDQASLERLAALYDKGQIKDTEAVHYFTLAASDAGAPYVEKVLSSGSVPAKAEAISYLAPLDGYRTQIRNEYLLNDTSNVELRATAARVLAKSDPDFGTYALTLISDPKLPTPVFKNIVSGVATKANGLDQGRIDALTKTIDRFQAGRPDADLGQLRGQIQSLKP